MDKEDTGGSGKAKERKNQDLENEDLLPDIQS